MEKVERFKRDCLSDISFYANNPIAPLFIAPESGPLVKFKMRRVQERMAATINRQWFLKGHLRIIVCKARRIGCTTLFCADAYRQATLRPNMNVVIGAQLDNMAEQIHERNHIFYNNYVPALRPERWGRSRSFREPMQFRRDATDEELIAWEAGGEKPNLGLNSSVSVFTEKTPLSRTGATIQYLLLSEFAKYRNQSTIIKEMFPTVRKGTGAIVIDTTAESLGDSYSRMWEEAVAGRSEFTPIFVSWLDDEQQCHQKPSASNRAYFHDWLSCVSMGDAPGVSKYSGKLSLDDDEFEILKDHILPRWQKMDEVERVAFHPMGWIEWRRWAIQNRCDGKAQIFRNQYPTHWREAFLSSSMTIFDMGQVDVQSKRIKDQTAPIRGELITVEGRRALDVDHEAMMSQVNMAKTVVTPGMFKFVEENFGPIRIYEKPIKGEEYIISSDYAEGQSDTCDYNVIHVYKRGDKLEQVAHFRERCYPEEAASEAIALGAYYNMAWQIPEVNSCGAAALSLFRSCYPVSRIFRRKQPDNAKKQSPTDLMGWRMTGRSKSEAVSSATTFFKQSLVEINNSNTLRELSVFVKKEGRMLPEAMSGTDPVTGERYFDDEVTCVVLGIFGHRQLPFRMYLMPGAQRTGGNECLHLMVAGGICVKCRVPIKIPGDEPLTFDKLRSMVKKRTIDKRQGNKSAGLRFWTDHLRG